MLFADDVVLVRGEQRGSGETEGVLERNRNKTEDVVCRSNDTFQQRNETASLGAQPLPED